MSCPVNDDDAPEKPTVCRLLKTMRFFHGMLRQG
jgi:hypothetical protein